MHFISRLFGHRDTKEAGQREAKQIKATDIGWKPKVRCREKGRMFDFKWTYKDGVIYKPKCQGCGKLFDIDNDEDHIAVSVS